MQVDYISDLHIDGYFKFYKWDKNDHLFKLFDFIIKNSTKVVGDVLVIAGDLGHSNEENIFVLKYLRKHFYTQIICVMGNHDFYLLNDEMRNKYSTSFQRVKEMKEWIDKEEGLYCLDGNIIEINGVKFGGCTSWYDNSCMKKGYYNKIKTYDEINDFWKKIMRDFKYVKGIKNFDDMFKIEIQKLEKIYKHCDVMITHINPSCKHQHDSQRFKIDKQLNIFYSFDGEEYLRNTTCKYWIFGHSHENFEFEEYGVKCLSNSLGYIKEFFYEYYVPQMKCFEI